MSIREHAAEWFLRLHARDLSVAERYAYLEWLKASPVHIAETLHMCRLYSLLFPLKKQLFFVNEDELSNVIGLPPRTNPSPPARTRSSWHVRLVAAAAVVLGLALTAGFVVQRDRLAHTIETRASEWRSLSLEDGSTVNVGPRTLLRDRFARERRVVHLAHGEALFKVAKDPSRPFIVDAHVAVVRATGTRFAVSRRGREVIVTVEEGAVVVSERVGSTGVSLAAGEQLTVTGVWPAPVVRVNTDRALAWSHRRLVFENDTVTAAADEFNRRNQLQIVVDAAFSAEQVHGSFHADDPLSFADFLATSLHGVIVREARDTVRLEPQRAARPNSLAR